MKKLPIVLSAVAIAIFAIVYFSSNSDSSNTTGQAIDIIPWFIGLIITSIVAILFW